VSTLAPTLQAYFTDHLIGQRRVSPQTVAAYRNAFRLLLAFVQERTGKPPSRLDLADLDAPLIGAFLAHLESERGNSVRTRNARLAAVHSLFRYAALRHPEDAAVIQRVLAIPPKRFDRTIVTYLTEEEIEALLDAPDQLSWTGRRDRTMLALAFQTGLRASELTALTMDDVHLGVGAHVSCMGKGRRQRITPLTAGTCRLLQAWLEERRCLPGGHLFPTRAGTRLSHDALARLVAKHVAAAASSCPTLRSKRVTPHVARHSAAMRLVRAGCDLATVALWLGHQNLSTTSIYVDADLALKERALAGTSGPEARGARRYKAPDPLLRFLDRL
jgi:site-specific recombinase XerD